MDRTSFPTDSNSAETLSNRPTDSALIDSAREIALAERRKKRRQKVPPDIVIGLDAEWVNGKHADPVQPDKTNWILSYQLFLLNRITGRSAAVVIPTGGPTRRD